MTIRQLVGDCREVLRTLPAESCHMAVTSPPYFQLRDYKAPGQIGLEGSPDAYVAAMVGVFREVWRVLRPDATLWLNSGDSYAGSGKGPSNSLQPDASQLNKGKRNGAQFAHGQAPTLWNPVPRGAKPKDLLLIPFRLALALQADGWYVRSDIAWCKKSCMPESVQDRPTSAWEHVFLLSKQAHYYYDAEAVREDAVMTPQARLTPHHKPTDIPGQPKQNGVIPARTEIAQDYAGRNQRNFWLLGPEPFSEAHFATFVPEIPRRAILAGTSVKGVCPVCGAPWIRETVPTPVYRAKLDPGRASPAWSAARRNEALSIGVAFGDKPEAGSAEYKTVGWRPSCAHVEAPPRPATVLDPFFGAGTTGLVADRLGRDCIGIEINEQYAEIARRRIVDAAPMFVEMIGGGLERGA